MHNNNNYLNSRISRLLATNAPLYRHNRTHRELLISQSFQIHNEQAQCQARHCSPAWGGRWWAREARVSDRLAVCLSAWPSRDFLFGSKMHKRTVVLIGITLQITLESADIELRGLVKAIPSSTTSEANDATPASTSAPNASPSVYQLCVCADSGKIFTAPPDKPCAANETICGPKHTSREQLSRDYTRLLPVDWLEKRLWLPVRRWSRPYITVDCFSSRLLFRSMFALMHFCFECCPSPSLLRRVLCSPLLACALLSTLNRWLYFCFIYKILYKYCVIYWIYCTFVLSLISVVIGPIECQ